LSKVISADPSWPSRHALPARYCGKSSQTPTQFQTEETRLSSTTFPATGPGSSQCHIQSRWKSEIPFRFQAKPKAAERMRVCRLFYCPCPFLMLYNPLPNSGNRSFMHLSSNIRQHTATVCTFPKEDFNVEQINSVPGFRHYNSGFNR